MCPECGSREDEFDPKKGGHRQSLEPQIWVCHGCRLAQESLSSANKDSPDMRGLKVRLKPTVYHPYNKPKRKSL